MKKIFMGILVLALLIGLASCRWVEQPQGVIRIIIAPRQIETQNIRLKMIPTNADYVRVRIWHEASSVNIIKTVEIQTDSSVIIEIALPAKAGYVIDAVSYDWDGRLLTGDRQVGVNIVSGETTNANLILATWGSGCSGDTEVEAKAAFNISFNLGGGGGLIQNCFNMASLLGSYTSFQDTSMDYPHGALTADDISNGQVSLIATMPDTDIEAIFYCVGVVGMIDAWYDYDRPSGPVTLHMELPNRFMGETIYQIIVTPPTGGIDITIE